MRNIYFVLLFIFLSEVAQGRTLEVNPQRLVEVIDIIDFSILAQANQLHMLSAKSKEPIYILLNSPGGVVQAGTLLASAMIAAKERGSKLICVSGVLAASMAFNLLAFCTERYALPYTKLLFHPVRIEGAVRPSDIPMLQEELGRIEKSTLSLLINMMGMPSAWVRKYYTEETLWEATDLVEATKDGENEDWLTIVNDVRGVSKLFVVQKPKLLFPLFPEQRRARLVQCHE